MARKIPLPRLTRRQRSARWQRERRQQAVIVTVFSAVLFFVLGLVSWGASSKYYTDNLKAAMTFDGRSVAMRDWTKEKAYELSRFYVEYGVPAGYENDPQIAEQKASFDRGALNTLEEYAILDKQAKAEAIVMTPAEIDARYEEDFSQFRSRHILITLDKSAPDQAVEDANALAKATAIRDQLRQDPNNQTLWNQLAKDYSQDPGSAPSGGELGWVGKGGFVPPFENAVKALAIGEISKQYSEDSATKDNGGDMGWIAHGVITDLSAEKELFTLDAGKVSQQHNGLTTTTWYKVIEKSDSRDLDDTQKKTISDNA